MAMKYGKPGCLLQKADRGQFLSFSLGCMLCLYLGILFLAQLDWQRVCRTSDRMEDALACSNLAAMVVDLKELGSTGQVRLCEPDRVFPLFLSALRDNLRLDENLMAVSSDLISGQVQLECFQIYNVGDTRVEILEWKNGLFERSQALPGQVVTPMGDRVEKTGIYSEISFDNKGILGQVYRARKGKLVDVTAERS